MENEFKKNIRYYIPRRVTRVLAQNKSRLHKIEKLRGGILYFDLVKFTTLTVMISESGPRAAETLHELMTKYYDLMIDIIHSYGGVVYQFAGDSAIAAFEETGGDEQEMIRVICACAIEMREVLENSNLRYKELKFAAKFSVAFGDYCQVLLGEDATYYQVAILGAAIDRVIQAGASATEGDIMIAPEIAEALKEEAVFASRDGARCIEKLNRPATPPEIAPEPVIEDEEKFLRKCARFMPPVLTKKIEAAIMGYIGEFRDVTCLFIQVEGVENSQGKKSIENLNEIYKHICELCNTYGGILIQSDFTDKGSVFLLLFGAPVALEKKELMAVYFALRLKVTGKLFPFIHKINVGIASGPLYCGDIGSTKSRGYSVMGRSVNLASRLMEYPTGEYPAIDQKTAKSLPETFDLEEIEGVRLKGIETSLSVFVVKGEKREIQESVSEGALVGRKKELALFKKLLVDASVSGITIGLIGDAGVGKSRLTQNFLLEARRANFQIFTGISYSYEKFTPYFPWKYILVKIFDINDEILTEMAIARIEDVLKNLENFETKKSAAKAWARVFYRLIGGSVDEIPYTLNMDPKKKNEQIFAIVGSIIEQQARQGQTFLHFEDFHWIDEGSGNLIRYIHDLNIPGLIILMVSRPEGPIYRFESFPRYTHLQLGEFSDEDALEYVVMKMDLQKRDAGSEKLEKEILQKGRGNPFFLESIVYSLREQGVLIEGGEGRYVLSGDNLQFEIPDSIQGVLLARIDRLSEAEKLVLVNASVIGRLFAFSLLKSIATEQGDNELLFHLEQLETSDFTILETREPLSYLFKHVLIRDVVYYSLLNSTREALHNRVALYLEGLGEEKIRENIDQLAYHFFNAKNNDKAVEYSLMAARKAKEAYSISDAIHHYENIIEMLNDKKDQSEFICDIKIELGNVYRHGGHFAESLEIFRDTLEKVRDRKKLARIHIGLGQVHQEQGDTDLAVVELEKAMTLLGKKVPRSGTLATLLTAIQLLKRGIYWLLPVLPLKVSGEKVGIYEMRFEVVEFLAKIYYFCNVEKFGWANLIQVNIADRLDNDRFKGRSYASLALVYGALGQFTLADKNIRKSEVYARRSSDPMTEAISWQRTATIEMYRNNTELWYKKLKKSAPFHEKFGETWEKILTLGAMNVPLMYQGKFREAKENNARVLKLAFAENIKQFQCWGLLTDGITSYWLNQADADRCIEDISRAIKIAEQGNDLGGYTSATRYLLMILICENRTEDALDSVRRVLVKLDQMTSIIPHCQSTYFQILEVVEMSLEKNLLEPGEAEKIRKLALGKLKKLGRKYKYIRGFSLRAQARDFVFKGNKGAAKNRILEAVDWYEKSENEWDRTRTYYDAARMVPEKRFEFIDKGIALCEKNGYARDLQRFQGLRESF